MLKLTPLKYKEAIKKLKFFGFEGPYAGGKHNYMIRIKDQKRIPIPCHGNKDISVGLIRAILKETDISREEWIDA